MNITVSRQLEGGAECYCCHTNGTLDTTNADKFRPAYHHTPLYGRMSDVNGLAYKDGEYHIYFQYHPYDSKDKKDWKYMSKVYG